MKLQDALINIQYDISWGIWAEKIEGEFTPESPARYGQKCFENGGVLDEKDYIGNGEEIGDSRYSYTQGDESFNEEWIDVFLSEIN